MDLLEAVRGHQHAGAKEQQHADDGFPERLEFDRHPRQAALGGAGKGQMILDQAIGHRARHRPLHRHRRDHGAKHLAGFDMHAQAIERHEMHQ